MSAAKSQPLPPAERARLLDQLYAGRLFQEPPAKEAAGSVAQDVTGGPETRKAAV
jgi:hypothetical protein